MLQCPECGAENTTGARGCVACGSKRLLTESGAVYQPPSEPATLSWLDVWQQFAAQVGGDYSFEGGISLGTVRLGQKHRVKTKVEQWVITLTPEKDEDAFTRMSAPYSPRQSLSFRAFRTDTVQNLAKRFLRLQDIEIGHPDFDEGFIIKGSDEARTRDLFASSELRSLLQSRQDLYLSSDGKMLEFVTDGWVTDIELLNAAHDLLDEALRELQHLELIE